MHLLSSRCLAAEERLSVKYPFGWAGGKIPIPASRERSNHMGHSQLLMEVLFSVSQFSGKTFPEVVSPPLESAWETSSRGKLCLWAVFTQGLQLCNRNRCHSVFYSFWCLKKRGKLLFLRGNCCQWCHSAKNKELDTAEEKKYLRISELSKRAIWDFATWRKQVRFQEQWEEQIGETLWDPDLGREELSPFLLGWVSFCASCSMGCMQFLIFGIFLAFEVLLWGLDRGPCSWSVHGAGVACNINELINAEPWWSTACSC